MEAITTIETVFKVKENGFYIPFELLTYVESIDVQAALNETVICLKDDLNCYIPIFIVDRDDERYEIEKVKCWNDWCYLVGEPEGAAEPDPNTDPEPTTDDTNTTTLCFDENSCFTVEELAALDALTTTNTTFTFNEKFYSPLALAKNVSEPDVSAVLTETVICLEGDLECYIPIEHVTENSETADKTVKCLFDDWCYIVGEPYSPDSSDNHTDDHTDNETDDHIDEPVNNETLPEGLSLCIDENCFIVKLVDSVEAITTNATIFIIGNDKYEPLVRTA